MQEQSKLLGEDAKVHEGKPRFTLSDKHREAAKEIIKSHITKRYLRKGCKRCNLTGVDFITDENLVRACPMCVNLPPAREEWNEYCRSHFGLKRWIVNG